MKIDELLAAIANLRQSMMQINGGARSAEETTARLNLLNLWRRIILRQDAASLAIEMRTALNSQSVFVGSVLGDFFYELTGSKTISWNDFETQFLEAA